MKKQQKYPIMVGALVALIIAVSSGPAHATSLTLIDPTTGNGSFEDPPMTGTTTILNSWQTGGVPTDWTVTGPAGADAALVKNGNWSGASAQDGFQFMLLQDAANPQTIKQDLTTTLGYQYEISFYYAALATGATDVNAKIWNMTWSFGDQTDALTAINENGTGSLTLTPWLHEIITFTADVTGTTTLSFTGDFQTQIYGPVLDNVTVNEIIPIPEPTTFALLLIGGGLMVFRRRSAS